MASLIVCDGAPTPLKGGNAGLQAVETAEASFASATKGQQPATWPASVT
jgi:hypothetical protein